ncbi:methylsterol monooxygenase [Mytilus galloprovincialis]|uniref:Methylsterol monooxygenase n=1 Tax=Mytilus galloprovincialis TaxID=29158 RepID=A0A8B6GJV8_MYTGA|nr:methylsterol monooxygenase [Mytilus galloprovincialis]
MNLLIIQLCSKQEHSMFLHQLYAASGIFWQNLWDSVYKLFGRNDFAVGVIDTTGKPGFLMKYKVQMNKNVPVDRKKLKKAVKLVLFNGFVVAFPMTLLGIYTMKLRGCAFSGDLPSFTRVVIDIIMFSLVEEFGFYYSHRLMHHPIVYKYIHKIHHEWTAPIGIICIYAHPLEHCLVNMMPVILGPIIMGSHLSTTWMWYFITLVSTTISHCGYHFPFLPSQEAHDFHHQMFINCFGVLGILDRLHGTDNIFRASKAYKRDKISLSLTPMSQQYPD